MAIIIAFDDSDGDYDHQMSPIFNGSTSPIDALNGSGICGSGNPVLGNAELRCGYGSRLPLLVISPYARSNVVDHSITDLTSILRFVEDNWSLGRIGGGSYDAIAGPLINLFDFTGRQRCRGRAEDREQPDLHNNPAQVTPVDRPPQRCRQESFAECQPASKRWSLSLP
jgi:phospholipase C